MKTNKIISFAQTIANETIIEKGGLRPFDTRYGIEQTKIITKDIHEKLRAKIKDEALLNEFSFQDETLIVLSIFSFFEQMSVIDESGKQIRSLLSTPMLFMYLFNNFQIKNTKYDQTCSVDDNIWIYEFISKIIEVFISVDHKLKPANLIDHKNIFMILMGIMHENFIHHLEAIPKIQISLTEESLAATINKASKEFKENIESIKKKLLAAIEATSSDKNSSILAFDEDSFLDRLTENLKQYIVQQEISPEILRGIAEFPVLFGSLEEKLLTFIEDISNKKISSDGALETAPSEKSSIGASDFLRLKEDIVKEAGQTVDDIFTKHLEEFKAIVTAAEKVVMKITEETEKLNQETATIRNIFLKIEEIEKVAKETNSATGTVIQLINTQNDEASQLLNTYNIKQHE